MSKIKTLSLGLGVVAGLSAAILPMSAYADDGPSATAAVDVNVNVATVIGMTLDTHSQIAAGGSTGTLVCDSTAIVEDDPSTPAVDESNDGCSGTAQVAAMDILPNTADLTTMYTDIYVSTNSTAGYTLTLIDSDDNTSLTNVAGDTIASINETPVAGTKPGWAVSNDAGTTWNKVPKNAGESTAAEAAFMVENYSPNPVAVATNRKSTVNYGVATSATQPTGTYTDTIVYTATAK